eukprot:272148_1
MKNVLPIISTHLNFQLLLLYNNIKNMEFMQKCTKCIYARVYDQPQFDKMIVKIELELDKIINKNIKYKLVNVVHNITCNTVDYGNTTNSSLLYSCLHAIGKSYSSGRFNEKIPYKSYHKLIHLLLTNGANILEPYTSRENHYSFSYYDGNKSVKSFSPLQNTIFERYDFSRKKYSQNNELLINDGMDIILTAIEHSKLYKQRFPALYTIILNTQSKDVQYSAASWWLGAAMNYLSITQFKVALTKLHNAPIIHIICNSSQQSNCMHYDMSLIKDVDTIGNLSVFDKHDHETHDIHEVFPLAHLYLVNAFYKHFQIGFVTQLYAIMSVLHDDIVDVIFYQYCFEDISYLDDENILNQKRFLISFLTAFFKGGICQSNNEWKRWIINNIITKFNKQQKLLLFDLINQELFKNIILQCSNINDMFNGDFLTYFFDNILSMHSIKQMMNKNVFYEMIHLNCNNIKLLKMICTQKWNVVFQNIDCLIWYDIFNKIISKININFVWTVESMQLVWKCITTTYLTVFLGHLNVLVFRSV